MEGFKIYNDSIKNSINKAGSFFLMIQDDDFEVFESNIKVGRSIICQPYECIDAINVAIVMEGRLFHTNEGSYIEKGQWFSFKNLEETHHLSVVEEVKLLMVRTKNVVDRQMKMRRACQTYYISFKRKINIRRTTATTQVIWQFKSPQS